MFITREQAYLLVDFRYFESASKAVSNLKIIELSNRKEQLSALCKKHNINNVAVEGKQITLHAFEDYQKLLSPVSLDTSWNLSSAIEKMRMIKTDIEVACIKKAQTITDNAFSEIQNHIKIGVTEHKIALELEFIMKSMGADRLAFETISVSGQNSSLPHGKFSDKKLAKGDFLTLDFGANVDGWCSDMTRTVAIGAVSEEQTHVYNTVLAAQLMALDKIKPEIKCCEIDKVARDYIYQNGFEGCFGHGLGHGVGLDIHEAPYFNKICDDKLQSGMIITVEPGIYLKNKFGVRIEDMILVTDSGYENLTKSSKQLIVL